MDALKQKFLSAVLAAVIVLSISSSMAMAANEPDGDNAQKRSTAQDFLQLNVRPIAIGHHGVGPNTQDPSLPIENTVDSVRLAYNSGARVVEVDVQLTKDGQLAVFHDDFLRDFTCIPSLTFDQLH